MRECFGSSRVATVVTGWSECSGISDTGISGWLLAATTGTAVIGCRTWASSSLDKQRPRHEVHGATIASTQAACPSAGTGFQAACLPPAIAHAHVKAVITIVFTGCHGGAAAQANCNNNGNCPFEDSDHGIASLAPGLSIHKRVMTVASVSRPSNLLARTLVDQF